MIINIRNIIGITIIFLSTCLMSCQNTTIYKEKFFKQAISRTQYKEVILTAYTHSEKDHRKYGVKTAIGTTLKNGVVATDWSVFPVGTKLRINGDVYVVEDYGSALVKSKDSTPVIDVYTPSKKQMNSFGKKYSYVQVVEWGDFDKSKDILKNRLKYTHCRVMYNRLYERH